jgi:hypothetical protein
MKNRGQTHEADRVAAIQFVDQIFAKAKTEGISVDPASIIALIESQGVRTDKGYKINSATLIENFDQKLRMGMESKNAQASIILEQDGAGILEIAFTKDEFVNAVYKQFRLERYDFSESWWQTPVWTWAEHYKHRGAWFRVLLWNESNPGDLPPEI